MPSIERLRSVLHYDAETGIFVWKQKLNAREPMGTRAGYVSKSGYWRLGLDGEKHYLHRWRGCTRTA